MLEAEPLGTIVPMEWKQRPPSPAAAAEALPRLLARMVEAGLCDFALSALTAWGRRELPPSELLDLCQTYAAVAGLRERGGERAADRLSGR